jgi:hypothetical protein
MRILPFLLLQPGTAARSEVPPLNVDAFPSSSLTIAFFSLFNLVFSHAFAAPSLQALLSQMITSVLLIASLFVLAGWIYRKHAMRRDHMGKKEDDFGSDRNASWADTGDELSFRRRM